MKECTEATGGYTCRGCRGCGEKLDSLKLFEEHMYTSKSCFITDALRETWQLAGFTPLDHYESGSTMDSYIDPDHPDRFPYSGDGVNYLARQKLWPFMKSNMFDDAHPLHYRLHVCDLI